MWELSDLTAWERQKSLESKMKIAAVAIGDVMEYIKVKDTEGAIESLVNIKAFLESS
jgi:hypothetical protein